MYVQVENFQQDTEMLGKLKLNDLLISYSEYCKGAANLLNIIR